MDDTIHVAFASDRNYSRPLAVTLASILANAGPGDSLFFHIVDRGLSAQCRDRIARLREIRDFAVEYLTLPEEPLKNAVALASQFYAARHGDSGAVFGRIFLPELLPELDRALYLDCDLLVLDSLKPLWNTPLDGKYAAWARDALEFLRESQKNVADFINSLGMKEGGVYCNSGVMLLSLEKARKRNMRRRFLALLGEFSHTVKTADQDICNILFQRDCVILPTTWNFQDPMAKWAPELTAADSRFAPKIVHFTTADKPWKEGNGCMHGGLYRRYAAMAGWELGPPAGNG